MNIRNAYYTNTHVEPIRTIFIGFFSNGHCKEIIYFLGIYIDGPAHILGENESAVNQLIRSI